MDIAKTAPRGWANLTHAVYADSPEEVREKCGDATYSLAPQFPKRFEAINGAAYEYQKRWVYFSLLRLKKTETDEVIEPALQIILDDITELSKEENYDGYIFKPTPHALRSARRIITKTYRKMGDRLMRPRVVPDGKGGIIMEWQNGQDVVKLGCVSTDTKRDYIYYRRGNVYDVVEASVGDLIKWLG